MMSKENQIKFISLSFIIILIITIFTFTYAYTILISKEVRDIAQIHAIENYVDEKNLSLPIPQLYKDIYPKYNLGIESKDNYIYLNEFSKDLPQYREFIKRNYMYDIDSYDCKYWSYVHSLYWKANHLKYDWKIDYITTDNHVFVMIYNESGYAILDQNNINWYGWNY